MVQIQIKIKYIMPDYRRLTRLTIFQIRKYHNKKYESDLKLVR